MPLADKVVSAKKIEGFLRSTIVKGGFKLKYRITVEDYIKFGTATPEMMEFLRACVEARISIVVSGGTGSGKPARLHRGSRILYPASCIIFT